jgi:hypothetical protein
MNTGQEARDTKNMGKDAHATDPAPQASFRHKYLLFSICDLLCTRSAPSRFDAIRVINHQQPGPICPATNNIGRLTG